MAQPLNAMELVQAWRLGEAKRAALEQEMQTQSLFTPYKIAEMETNALAKREAIQQSRNALSYQMQRDRERNVLARDVATMRANALANRPARPNQIIQAEDGIYERLPDGSIRPVTGPSGQQLRPKGSEKPMTEFQGKSSGYGTRAQSSHDILLDLEGDISTSGLAAKQAVQNTPIVGGALGVIGNTLLSSEQQRVDQAQRDFVNAVLRQESGAAISMGEFDNAKKQYFPQPGDSDETIKQKRRNRELAVQGFENSAGETGARPIREVRQEAIRRRGGGGGAFDDPDKERRYQEWKARQR